MLHNQTLRRVIGFSSGVALLLLVGTFGYVLIEDFSVFEAFYMTLITVTTVGFEELKPLTLSGRVLTSFLIIFGVGIVAYGASQIMSTLLSIDFRERRRLKLETKIRKLKDHAIVCGFGRMGSVISEELSKAEIPFVVIEKREQSVTNLEKTNYLWLDGDAADDDVLVKAGVRTAKTLISTVDNDADGIYLTLAARANSSKIQIIARANKEEARKKMRLAGADRVILPYVMSGLKVAESIINPMVEDFFDITGDVKKESRIKIFDIVIEKNSPLISHSLNTFGVKRNGLIIVGIRHADGSFVFAPEADYQFKSGDCLIAMGTLQSYEESVKLLHEIETKIETSK